MEIKSIYPVFIVKNIAETREFYTKYFGFQISFELEWFLNLNHPSNSSHRLVFVKNDHESVPHFYLGKPLGFALDFEVSDAESEYEVFQNLNVKMVQELRDESFGERHFIVGDPDGVLINVTQRIPLSPEFAG